jgi:hypothetical protein
MFSDDEDEQGLEQSGCNDRERLLMKSTLLFFDFRSA